MATNFRAFSIATAMLAGAAFMALADRPAAAADEIAIPLPFHNLSICESGLRNICAVGFEPAKTSPPSN